MTSGRSPLQAGIDLSPLSNLTDASGICSVTETKAADTNYNIATSLPANVTLTKADTPAIEMLPIAQFGSVNVGDKFAAAGILF